MTHTKVFLRSIWYKKRPLNTVQSLCTIELYIWSLQAISKSNKVGIRIFSSFPSFIYSSVLFMRVWLHFECFIFKPLDNWHLISHRNQKLSLVSSTSHKLYLFLKIGTMWNFILHLFIFQQAVSLWPANRIPKLNDNFDTWRHRHHHSYNSRMYYDRRHLPRHSHHCPCTYCRNTRHHSLRDYYHYH